MGQIKMTESLPLEESEAGLKKSVGVSVQIISTEAEDECGDQKRNAAPGVWGRCEQLYNNCSPRMTVLLGATSTVVVFLINMGLVIWATKKEHGSPHVFSSSCNSVQLFSTGIHVLINTLSAILLGASNFAMQILCAPSRSDIDRAHAENRWMSIGVQSPRNLLRLSWFRLALWIILGLSSIPLHLMYNSIFFSTMTDHYYDVYFTSEDWLQGAPFDEVVFPHLVQEGNHWLYPPDWNHTVLPLPGSAPSSTSSDGRWPHQTNPHLLQRLFSNDKSRFEVLTPAECIQRYQSSYISVGSNVIVVGQVINRIAFRGATHPVTISSSPDDGRYSSRGVHLNSSLLNIMPGKGSSFDPFTGTDSFEWWCDPSMSGYPNCTRLTHLQDHSTPFNWTLIGFFVTQCASEVPKDQCALNLNRELAVVVMAMNLLKAIALIIVYFTLKNHPILTFGDAVASFMSIPDKTTQDLCLKSRKYFDQVEGDQKRLHKRRHDRAQGIVVACGPTIRRSDPPRYMRYHEYRCCRGNFAGVDSCAAYACFWTLCFTTTCVLLISTSVSKDTISAGLDEVFSANLIRSWALSNNVVATTIVANLPQAILSALYVLLNNFVTRICMGIEWCEFSRNRQPLRLSSNITNHQRSTHFLHLPLRYSALILSTSGLLHWLASQAFYFVEVDTYDASGNLASVMQTCGFSRLAIGLVIMVMVLVFAGTVAFSRWGVEVSMPFAGSCSKAIAAACHPPEKGSDPTLPLQWGAVPDASEGWIKVHGKPQPVGHCSFSSGDVEVPVASALYA